MLGQRQPGSYAAWSSNGAPPTRSSATSAALDVGHEHLRRVAGHRRDRYMGPFNRTTANPVLVVGNRFDPATRYEGALTVHNLLPRSALLTVHGWGHTSLFLSHCADDGDRALPRSTSRPPRPAPCASRITCPSRRSRRLRRRCPARAGHRSGNRPAASQERTGYNAAGHLRPPQRRRHPHCSGADPGFFLRPRLGKRTGAFRFGTVSGCRHTTIGRPSGSLKHQAGGFPRTRLSAGSYCTAAASQPVIARWVRAWCRCGAPVYAATTFDSHLAR